MDGKKRKFIIDDPLVYESMTISPAGGVEQSIVKWAGMPARGFREFITREPGFVIANLIRDTMSAFVTSGSNFTPFLDTLKGFAEGSEALTRTGVVGGYDYRNDPENIGKYAQKLSSRLDPSRDYRGFFSRAWDLLGEATTVSDAATRNAVYKDVLARTGNEAEAHFQAMEVLNFGRRGSNPLMRVATATIPFLNARLQGLDVINRAATGKNTANKELSRGQAAASFITRGLLITASTAIYYTMVSDDEQYKNQTEEIKDNYWLIPTPYGFPARIPIPFEIGLLYKTLPERLIDAYNDGTTGRELGQSARRAVFGTLAIQPPQAITPILETYMNYDLWTGRAVTPVYIDSNIDPQMQALSSTTEVARQISKVIPMSPINLDHLMRGYGGTLGSYVLEIADTALRSKMVQGDNRAVLAGTNLFQKPILRRFAGSEFGGGPAEDFYEMFDYVKRIDNTAKDLLKKNRLDELESYLVNRRQFLGMRDLMQPTATALSKLREQRRLVQRADISSDLKEEYLRKINEQQEYYLSVVPQLERYVKLPTLTETAINRVSGLF